MENTTKSVRINKYLAKTIHCSRREADEIVKRGWVMIDSAVCHEMGFKVTSEHDVEVHEQAFDWLGQKQTVVMNKPPGYISGPGEEKYPSALDILREDSFGGEGETPPLHRDGLAPLGRLDVDSSGLLLLSQSGVLARIVIGPESEVEKEYVVKVGEALSDKKLEELGSEGFELDGKKLKKAFVERINETQFRMILKEGKKRQIRRMCESVSYTHLTLPTTPYV